MYLSYDYTLNKFVRSMYNWVTGKLVYSRVIEVYGQYKDDIDEILVLEGMEHLKEK